MIHNIETLPFVTFIKIIETDDYYLLLKERSVFNWVNKLKVKLFRLDLQKAFEEIREEYSDGEGSLRVKKVKSLKNKMDKLIYKYTTVISALEVLKRGKDDEMLAILKERGYELKGKDYVDSINIIYRQTDNLKNEIDTIKKELEGYLDVVDEDVKVRPQKVLIQVMNGLEFQRDTSKVTVIEYQSYKQTLAEKVKQQKKSIKGGKRR